MDSKLKKTINNIQLKLLKMYLMYIPFMIGKLKIFGFIMLKIKIKDITNYMN